MENILVEVSHAVTQYKNPDSMSSYFFVLRFEGYSIGILFRAQTCVPWSESTFGVLTTNSVRSRYSVSHIVMLRLNIYGYKEYYIPFYFSVSFILVAAAL